MNQKLIKILTDIGLNEKQARVYLAILQLNDPKVAEIAKSSKVHRVTVYDILKNLQNMGLVSVLKKNKENIYRALDPKELVLKQEQKLLGLRSNLVELQTLQYSVPSDMVRYFEGKENLTLILNDILTSKSDILCFLQADELINSFFEESINFMRKRQKQKLGLKILCQTQKAYTHLQKLPYPESRKVKLVKADAFASSLYIYDNKIAMIDYSSLRYGIIIENPHMTQTQRSVFELIWKSA